MPLPRPLFPATPPVDFHPLGALLTYQATRDPDFPALSVGDITLTRAQLDARANRRARALEAMGVGQDDYVVVSLPDPIAFHETTFAAWKLGAIPAPVSWKLPDHEFGGIVELLKPKLVAGADAARAAGFQALPVEFEPDPLLSGAPLPVRTSSHWKASPSGGSTGRPKIILDVNPSVLDPHVPLLGIEVDDVVLHPGPLYHNSGFAQTHWAFCWGAHVIGMTKFDALEWLRLVERHRVKWAYLVPTMMSRIWNLPPDVKARFDLSSLEVVIHMAAPCPAWLKQAWIDWLGPERIWEVYAGTEAMGGTIINGLEWLERPGSVGRLIPGYEMRIFDENGAPCAPGQIGEIYFLPQKGAGSTYRYLGAEVKAIGDWQSYGDLGAIDAEGFLFLADRRTDLILRGGANIYPAEVEAALDAHPLVASSVVIGLPDADLGQRVHAIVELKNPARPPEDNVLSAFLAERLARYKCPTSYEFVAEPLRDDAGKVRRSALREARLSSPPL